MNPITPPNDRRQTSPFNLRPAMEKLAGDLLFGFKFVKLSILPTLHTVCLAQVGRIEVMIFGIKGLTSPLNSGNVSLTNGNDWSSTMCQ